MPVTPGVEVRVEVRVTVGVGVGGDSCHCVMVVLTCRTACEGGGGDGCVSFPADPLPPKARSSHMQTTLDLVYHGLCTTSQFSATHPHPLPPLKQISVHC